MGFFEELYGVDCRYTDLEIGKKYSVTESMKTGKWEKESKKLMLIDINDSYLTFQNKIGIIECFINHNNLVCIQEIDNW